MKTPEHKDVYRDYYCRIHSRIMIGECPSVGHDGINEGTTTPTDYQAAIKKSELELCHMS